MIRKKWIDIVAVIGITFALLFSITLAYFPNVFALEAKGVTKQYETQLFDKDAIMSIDILMSDEDWQDMLDNAASEEYYSCDVVVNGVTYRNVGIRPKGNTSLSQIVSDDTTDRYSFKLEFDHYDSTQTCMGLDKLVLNNMMADATYRKEYISYDIMSYLGVETSLYSYASVSHNGENWGLYFALEAMEESYAERVFGSSYGELYKPDSMEMGGGGGGGFGGSQASNLQYIDDEIDSYSVIFDAAVFEPTEADKESVIEALKNVSEGTNLEDYVDVDAMLRYIASNTFLVNDDGYFGSMVHNYYLYEENGKLTMLPWDYNLAFGGFQSQNASSLINRGIDDVVSGNLEERPMIASLLAVEEYQQQYYELLDELISGYFESGRFTEVMDKLDALLDSYVAEDPTAFYTYEEYTAANETLRVFCEKRAESIREQLDGNLAKTASEQTSDTKIDATTVTITTMGSQFGGGGEHDMAGGRGGFGQRGESTEGTDAQTAGQSTDGAAPQMPEGMEMPEGMQAPGGMEMPEGMQAPEGMEMPEGMQAPGGMEMPEGMQAPEGMEMPEGMQSPEGMQQPANAATEENAQSANTEQNQQGGVTSEQSEEVKTDSWKDGTQNGSGKENVRGGGMQNGGFPGNFNGEMPEGAEEFMKNFSGDFPGMSSTQNTNDAVLWLAISAAVMLAGLLFVRFYPKSRF